MIVKPCIKNSCKFDKRLIYSNDLYQKYFTFKRGNTVYTIQDGCYTITHYQLIDR